MCPVLQVDLFVLGNRAALSKLQQYLKNARPIVQIVRLLPLSVIEFYCNYISTKYNKNSWSKCIYGENKELSDSFGRAVLFKISKKYSYIKIKQSM